MMPVLYPLTLMSGLGEYEAVLTETTFTALLVTTPDTPILPGTVVTYNEEPVGFVTSGSTQNLLCHYY